MIDDSLPTSRSLKSIRICDDIRAEPETKSKKMKDFSSGSEKPQSVTCLFNKEKLFKWFNKVVTKTLLGCLADHSLLDRRDPHRNYSRHDDCDTNIVPTSSNQADCKNTYDGEIEH